MGTDRFASTYLHFRSSRIAAIALALTGALLGSLAPATAPARATTKAFGFTGSEQIFVVPSGVTKLHVLLVGAEGGVGGGAGGLGAEVSADLEVTPGQTLYIEVGGAGKDSGEGGGVSFNGGAAGGGGLSAGGGGASDIRLLPRASGLSPDTRLVVAAGGGGGGGVGEEFPGDGGDAGNEGGIGGGANGGGGAGSASAGGAGGSGCGQSGTTGELGEGGGGGGGESVSNGGGGGGGGLFGGGGGAGGCVVGGGGGGGGSSFIPPGGTLQLASEGAVPGVAIDYTLPSAPASNPPASNPGVTLPIPNTVLGFHPPKNVKTANALAKVKFTFSADVAGATFRCKVDKGTYAPCASPKRFKAAIGKHKFSVVAIKDGVADPTPASFKFKVVKAS